MAGRGLADFRAAVLADVPARAAARAAAWQVRPAPELPPVACAEVSCQNDSDDEPSLEAAAARGYEEAALRYSALTVAPGAAWNVSWTGLEAARTALETLRSRLGSIAPTGASPAAPRADGTPLRRFADALLEHLDTATALEVVWQVVHGDLPADQKQHLLLEFDRALDLGLAAAVGPARSALPDEAKPLIEARNEARRRKDWARSDALRAQLAALDVEAQDGPDDSVYRRAGSAG
jgi:cysteinyl-tRNA synthetase